MSNPNVDEIVSDAIAKVSPGEPSEDLSLESLSLLVHVTRLKHLEDKITAEFTELRKRQDQVSFLNKLIKTINTATRDGELDITNNKELQDLLKKATEYGVTRDEKKTKFNKNEREALIENIRLTVGDFNVLNDMQLQTVTRLANERHESHQLARSIMKPLHEAKVNHARSASGR